MKRFLFSLWIIVLTLAFVEPAFAQQETIYMSVLSSRKYRLNVSDNPLVGLFVSTDQGATWRHRGWKEYIRVFYTEAASDGTIWSACGNGVLHSTDDGNRWRITSGWRITEVLKVRTVPDRPSTVYAATAYGLFKSTDDGGTWIEKSLGLKLGFTSDVVIDRSDERRIFVATEQGVFRSTDAGTSWSQVGLSGKGVRTLLQDPHDPAVIWAGTESNGVYRSPDRGDTWVNLVDGLQYKTVYAIAVRPDSASVVFAGTHDGGVYISRDGGRHWRQSNTGLTNHVVHALVILPSNPDVIFAGTLNGGLFRSTNGGSSWEFNSQDEGQVWGLSVRER